MSNVTYEIVEHDGGWAYKVDGVFSEPFPTTPPRSRPPSAPPPNNGSPATPRKSSSRTKRANGTPKPRAAATARKPSVKDKS